MKLIASTLLLIAGMYLIACNQTTEKSTDVDMKPLMEAGPLDNEKEMATDTFRFQQQLPPGKSAVNSGTANIPAKIDWDKKIIRTAILNAEVKDFNAYYSGIREKVKALGGYIAEENQSQTDYKIENTIIVKVPVDQFDNAVGQISAGTLQINEKRVSSQDVTTEMVDTKSRIEAKRHVRDRYMDLLKQAKNMEEIIQVEKEIQDVQEQIEHGAGRINYLGQSTSYSTIQLTYFQVLNATAIEDDKQPSFGDKVLVALENGWTVISSIFIGLITIWPILLISFICYLLYRKLKIQKPKAVS